MIDYGIPVCWQHRRGTSFSISAKTIGKHDPRRVGVHNDALKVNCSESWGSCNLDEASPVLMMIMGARGRTPSRHVTHVDQLSDQACYTSHMLSN